jgi:MFS family permease
MKKHYMISLLSNGAQSASNVFIPLIAAGFGAAPFEIGLIVMLSAASRFVSDFLFGRFSDILGRRRAFIKVGLLVASAAFFLQVLMYDIFSMIIIRLLAGFTMGICYFPLIAQISSSERYKRSIGRFSSYGSLGWVLGYAAAAMMPSYQMIFAVSGAMLLAAFILSVLLPDLRESRIRIPFFPKGIIKKNLRLYLSVIMRHTGANAVWVIFPLYLAGIGFSKAGIALLFAINPLTQVFLFQLVGHFSEKRDEAIFIKASFLASFATFTLFLFFTDALTLGLSMIVLGISWSFMWAGSIIHLTGRNLERATATGMLGSVIGISATIGPLAGGLIAQLFGFQATFVFATLCAMAGFLTSMKI